MRELRDFADEMDDPEASYRRGYHPGAEALLRHVASQLEPDVVEKLREWVTTLRAWRLRSREESRSVDPPPPLEI